MMMTVGFQMTALNLMMIWMIKWVLRVPVMLKVKMRKMIMTMMILHQIVIMTLMKLNKTVKKTGLQQRQDLKLCLKVILKFYTKFLFGLNFHSLKNV